MNFRFTDYPREEPLSFYNEALDAMTARLMESGAVTAVYQLGGISNPGISDLDMLAVFKNEVEVDRNFLDGLSEDERYLFIHNVYGISENNFDEAQEYAFYFNYKFLAGKDLKPKIAPEESDLSAMKKQVALEFLLKFYITLQLQKEYGVFRMRDLLLHVKALQYDLEFLGITNGIVSDGVSQVIQWRNNWFNVPPAKSYVNKWINNFLPSLNELVIDTFKNHSLYLPPQEEYNVAKNIQLIPSSGKITVERKGLLLPVQLSVYGKKYFRLQNKLNRFRVPVPVRTDSFPPVLEKKFQFEKKIIAYNKKFLPHFLPLTSSLHAI
jgi:hypothetical protein